MKGFSPVRIIRCGSATLMFFPPFGTGPCTQRFSGLLVEPSRRTGMSDLFRRGGVILVAIAAVALPAVAQAQSEPPGRIGRLAYTQGTVSFHDPQQEGWTQAIPNTPLT